MKMTAERLRGALLVGAAASVLALATGAQAQNQNSPNQNNGNPSAQQDNSWPYTQNWHSPVLAVVGDISCQPGEEAPGESGGEVCTDAGTPYSATALWESQEATANQIEGMKPDAVALLGDLQYQVGRYSDFQQSFDLTYGAFKFLHRPAPGNHEFYDEHGETGVGGYGYFSYYNGFQANPDGSVPMITISDPCPVPDASCKAGKTPVGSLPSSPIPRTDGQAGHFEPTGGLETAITPAGAPVGVGDGWYSYNLGSWHLISLNIECYTQPGGCSTASGTWLAAETEWLKNDLAQNHSACTLAYWHQPTFSADDGLTQEGITAGTWWQLLYEAGADLVLNGHDHLYARYAPIKPYFAAGDTSVSGVTGTWLGTPDPVHGIREFIVGTGGETLDTPVFAPSSATDWDGIFNQQFLQAATGNYFGVMQLTLDPYGYQWNYTSAMLAPVAPAGTQPTFFDGGAAFCHGAPNRGGVGQGGQGDQGNGR
jgi:acid phosphatase type 7